MLKEWGSSIFVGLVSAFLVTGLIQQMWGVEWRRAVAVGVIVFILGVGTSQVFRRLLRMTNQD